MGANAAELPGARARGTRRARRRRPRSPALPEALARTPQLRRSARVSVRPTGKRLMASHDRIRRRPGRRLASGMATMRSSGATPWSPRAGPGAPAPGPSLCVGKMRSQSRDWRDEQRSGRCAQRPCLPHELRDLLASPWSTFSSQPARGSLIKSSPGWRRSIAATALSSRAVLAQPSEAFDPCMASRRNGGEMTLLDRQDRRRSPLASGSVREHLLRGAAGLSTAALAIVPLAVVGPVSLVLLPVTAAAWRISRSRTTHTWSTVTPSRRSQMSRISG
jgi:hypothetical protein